MKTIDGVEVKNGDTVYQWHSCEPWIVSQEMWATDCYYSTRRTALLGRLKHADEAIKAYHDRIRATLREIEEVETEKRRIESELDKESTTP